MTLGDAAIGDTAVANEGPAVATTNATLTEADVTIPALKFDGDNEDRVVVSHSSEFDFDHTTPFTFAIWSRYDEFVSRGDGIDTSTGPLFAKGTFANSFGLDIDIRSSTYDPDEELNLWSYRFGVRNGGNSNIESAARSPDGLGQIEHVVGRYEPIDATTGRISLFIDGVEVASQEVSVEDFSNTDHIGINEQFTGGNNQRQDTTLHDARIYDRALSDLEIQNLSNGQHISNGLVGWWPLDDGSGTTATDQSGNGNDGTLVNDPDWTFYRHNGVSTETTTSTESATPVTSQTGGYALAFDDQDDSRVSHPQYSFSDAEPHTVIVWMQATDTMDDWVIPFGDIDHNYHSIYFANQSGTSAPAFRYRTEANNFHDIVGSHNWLNQDVWMIAWTVESDRTITVYENGNLASSSQVSETDMAYDSIGRGFAGDSGYGFTGIFDDVRIYDRALSESEIQDLYNGQHITDGLVGWWPLNDGSGTTAEDRSGNGNDGTLVNDPEWTAPISSYRPNGISTETATADETATPVSSQTGGYALEFNESSYVDVSSGNYDITQGETVSFWARLEQVSTEDQWRGPGVYSVGLSSFDDHLTFGRWEHTEGAITSGVVQTTVQLEDIDGNHTESSVFDYDLDTNPPIHVTVRFEDDGNISFFVDGSLLSEESAVFAGNTLNYIGPGYGGSTDDGRKGKTLDDFRVYNRLLSDSEVQNLANGQHISDGLVRWWTLNDGYGDTATDLSDNDNHGTLANNPQWTSPISAYRPNGVSMETTSSTDGPSITTGVASPSPMLESASAVGGASVLSSVSAPQSVDANASATELPTISTSQGPTIGATTVASSTDNASLIVSQTGGYAVEFNNDNDEKISIAHNNLDFSPVEDEFTITGWAERVSGSTGTVILRDHTLDSTGVSWDGGHIDAGFRDSNGDNYWVTANPATDIFHYTVVYDGPNNTVRLFIDGEHIDDVDTSGSVGVDKVGESWDIGGTSRLSGSSSESDKVWRGDDMRIYNRTLSSSEATALANGQHIIDGLVGWWPLNDGYGDTAADLSGNNNDGTLVNDPEWTSPISTYRPNGISTETASALGGAASTASAATATQSMDNILVRAMQSSGSGGLLSADSVAAADSSASMISGAAAVSQMETTASADDSPQTVTASPLLLTTPSTASSTSDAAVTSALAADIASDEISRAGDVANLSVSSGSTVVPSTASTAMESPTILASMTTTGMISGESDEQALADDVATLVAPVSDASEAGVTSSSVDESIITQEVAPPLKTALIVPTEGETIVVNSSLLTAHDTTIYGVGRSTSDTSDRGTVTTDNDNTATTDTNRD